ncbi:MAG: hypothetical protein ABI411_14040 [Tahibacter sp.]
MTRVFLLIGLLAGSAQAGPLDWVQTHLFGKSDEQPTRLAMIDPGPIALSAERSVQFQVGADAPEAELPRGRSHFRRVELASAVPEATLQVRVLAQEAEKGRARTVFKPLLYVLDDNGDVREIIAIDPLRLDMRPFQRTELRGCAKVKNLQKFLVATEGIEGKGAYESGARDSVKAPTQYGFYYSTDATKIKLPFAATGELVLKVSATPPRDAHACEAPKAEASQNPKGDKTEKNKAG